MNTIIIFIVAICFCCCFNTKYKPLSLLCAVLENTQEITEWVIEVYAFLKSQKATLHYQYVKRIQRNVSKVVEELRYQYCPNGYFCNNWNVLYLLYPAQEPQVVYSYWHLKYGYCDWGTAFCILL